MSADPLEKEKQLFELIKRRYDLELQRARDFDSKAGNLIGYVTIITGLLLGIGTFDILDKTTKPEYYLPYFIGIGLLLLSMCSSLTVLKLKKYNIEPNIIDLKNYVNNIDDNTNFDTWTIIVRSLTAMQKAIIKVTNNNSNKAFKLKISWYLLVAGIALILIYLGIYVFEKNASNSGDNIYVSPTMKAIYEMNPTVDRSFINSKFGNVTNADDLTKVNSFPYQSINTTKPWIDINYQWLHDNLTVDIVTDTMDNITEASVRQPIQKWSSLLKSASNNFTAWNFNITYFNSDNITLAKDEADIVLTLRDEPNPSQCINRYGYSMPFDRDPHPQYILAYTSCEGVPISEDQIATTIMHEFGHALGLGHTHNQNKDLMCSFEKGAKTCSALADPKTDPSDLNLQGIFYIYGTDGFDGYNRVLVNKPYFVYN